MSDPRNSLPEGSEPRLRRPGRVRAAWLALTGHPVVPDQLRAEWASWAMELENLCDKLTVAAARMLQRDRRELEKVTAERDQLLAEKESDVTGLSFSGDGGGYSPLKRALNRRLLAGRGVSIPQANGVSNVDGAESE